MTWALATSRWCSIPGSGAPPLTTSGGVPPGAVKIVAPIARRGRAMRVIGRPRSESSPSSTTCSIGLAHQQAGDQAHQGARVVAVERRRRPQAAQPAPVTRTAVAEVALHRHPAVLHGLEGRAGVRRVERPADADLAVGDGRQQERAMGQRLVRRHLDGAAEQGYRCHADGRHPVKTNDTSGGTRGAI